MEKEFVTKIWKHPERGGYTVITQEIIGEDIKFDFHFFDDGKEVKSELVAEYHNLGPPLSLGLCSSPPLVYKSKEKLLEVLSASGLKPEEIERLKVKL